MKGSAVIVWAAVLSVSAPAQVLWAPKPAPGKYVAPHKPHTKLADVKARHEGKPEWRELVVDDEHLRSEYIQSRPGSREPRQCHPDTRAWWVVLDGEIRFDIEGQTPFVARKGSMVQVPMQTLFSLETVGDKPALRFETNIAGAKTLYAEEPSADLKGRIPYMPVAFRRLAGNYEGPNKPWSKPHVTFEEVAQAIEKGAVKGTQHIVEDDRGAANFIYGYKKNLPPINPNDKGHYHPEGAEFWLIMKGQIRYPIEGQGVIIASEGDVVYVPKFTFHAPRWYGDGPSCRLAMNGYPNIAHLFEPKRP